MGEHRSHDWWRLVPMYWFQNEATNWEWDDILSDALDNYEPVAGYLTCKVGPLEVWTGNWPYAYGSLYSPKREGLPSVTTRRRLRKALSVEDYAAARAAILLATKDQSHG